MQSHQAQEGIRASTPPVMEFAAGALHIIPLLNRGAARNWGGRVGGYLVQRAQWACHGEAGAPRAWTLLLPVAQRRGWSALRGSLGEVYLLMTRTPCGFFYWFAIIKQKVAPQHDGVVLLFFLFVFFPWRFAYAALNSPPCHRHRGIFIFFYFFITDPSVAVHL